MMALNSYVAEAELLGNIFAVFLLHGRRVGGDSQFLQRLRAGHLAGADQARKVTSGVCQSRIFQEDIALIKAGVDDS